MALDAVILESSQKSLRKSEKEIEVSSVKRLGRQIVRKPDVVSSPVREAPPSNFRQTAELVVASCLTRTFRIF